MHKIAGIGFKNTFTTYDYNIDDIDVNIGDFVIVENENGLQIATVKYIKESDKKCSETIIRKANKKDIEMHHKNQNDELKDLIKIKDEVEKLGLDMGIIDCNYNLDKSHLMIYFVSQNRVDFRELAKSLAKKFKTRIQFHQIGIRDKARLVGGYGPCGQKFCCYRFLNEISPININMAKNQRLALNPSKINGVCGRLMCCLEYENDAYKELGKNIPNVGSNYSSKNYNGKVLSVDVLNQKFTIITENKELIEIDASIK